MTINPLNDISRVYLEKVAESAVPGKPSEKLGAVTAIPKAEQEAARERLLAKAKEIRKKKGIEEAAKPDYLDFDGDGNKKESMKKALRDKAKQKVEEAKKPNDGNLANNYPPYDKVTRGDVIAGALGKDQMGGKKKKTVKEGFSNWREDLIEVVGKLEGKDGKEPKIVEKSVNNKININPNLDLGEAVENLGGTLLEMVEIENFEGVLDELTESEIFLLSDQLIEQVVEEFFYECIEEGYDILEVENRLIESLEISSSLLTEEESIKESKLEKIKGAVKRVGKALARGVGYVAGAAVRGVKAAGREMKSGYERGRSGSSPSTEKQSSAPSSSSSDSEDSDKKKPGLLSRIGSKLKRGLVKAARAVSRGSRNVARKLEGGGTKKADTPKTAPKKAEKPEDPWSGSATTPPKSQKPKATTKRVRTPAPKPETKAKPAPKRKAKISADERNELLKSVRSESVIGDRARNAVADQRLDDAQGKTQSSVNKLKKGRKSVTRASASIAAKKSEDTARRMHPKPKTGAYRVEEIQINEMPYQVMGSPDGKTEKKIGKPVKSRKYADARAAELEDTHKKTGGKYRSQYVENAEYIDEKTLSDAEKAKKEEIFKKYLKPKRKDFESRYPGRGEEVMHGVATNIAKKVAK